MRSLTICFGLIVLLGSEITSPVSHAEMLLSTSHGLDMSQLHLVVDAPPEYDEQLYERARDRLVQAGLYTKTKYKNAYKQWEPLFSV